MTSPGEPSTPSFRPPLFQKSGVSPGLRDWSVGNRFDSEKPSYSGGLTVQRCKNRMGPVCPPHPSWFCVPAPPSSSHPSLPRTGGFPLDFVANCHNGDTMSKSIRISDELASRAQSAAVLSHRSPPQQIEHWAQLGRILEPALSLSAVEAVKRAGRRDLDRLLDDVETDSGVERSREVIRRTSGSIETTDSG